MQFTRINRRESYASRERRGNDCNQKIGAPVKTNQCFFGSIKRRNNFSTVSRFFCFCFAKYMSNAISFI
jgi:hypothetical protein